MKRRSLWSILDWLCRCKVRAICDRYDAELHR